MNGWLRRSGSVLSSMALSTTLSVLPAPGGGRNLVWKVGVASGAFSILADFPLVPNPLAPGVGGPFSEAVPTGIASSGGSLLVALFRGVPFAPGTSDVVPVDPPTGSYIDPLTGGHIPLISGLKTAIGVLPIAVL